MSKRMDAHTLIQMVISGANNMENNRALVDALNVFPVPDGDTGSNMSMTMSAAAAELMAIEEIADVKQVAITVSSAMLRGARGNSGVILSQIFRGVSKALTDNVYEVDTAGLAAALTKGTQAAFRAVMKPVEGTILTVVRECAHAAYKAYKRKMEVVDAFEFVVEQGNIALERTPLQLPQLKQAGVVDSGGKGLMVILEGMLAALKHEMIQPAEGAEIQPLKISRTPSAVEVPYAYCTEFLVMKKNISSSSEVLKPILVPKGDSLLVIDDDDLIKVHIHTNHPGVVLEEALKLGELFGIKIENMKEQAGEGPVAEKVPVAVAAVAAGDGFSNIFTDLGAAFVIVGGQTMNPSTEDILAAVKRCNAEHVIILPNNKNIIMSANQAGKISDTPISVINSKTLPQGICAMLAYDGGKDVQTNVENMQNSLSNVKTVQITHAVRGTVINGIDIKQNEYIGLVDSDITVAHKELEQASISAVRSALWPDAEMITIYYGEDVSAQDAGRLVDALEQEHPDLEFSLQRGGQPVYYYIAAIE